MNTVSVSDLSSASTFDWWGRAWKSEKHTISNDSQSRPASLRDRPRFRTSRADAIADCWASP